MGKRIVLGVLVVLGLFVWIALAEEKELLKVEDNIYIGKPIDVTVNVEEEDTLIVLNLNTFSMHEFKFEGGKVQLCFVRPCDNKPSSCAVILANPGDEILFILKNTPLEMRRKILRLVDKPEVRLELVEKEQSCSVKIEIKYQAADLRCERDTLSAEFYVGDQQKAYPVTLVETGPATGIFTGEVPIQIEYEDGQFTISYTFQDGEDAEPIHIPVTQPELPKAFVQIHTVEEDTQKPELYPLDLFAKLEKLPDEIPDKIRLVDDCKLTLELIKERIKCHFEPKPEVYLDLIDGKLCVVVKDGCQYKVGVKDVEVLQPVRLVIKDESGQEVHGGRLEAGKTYTIEAINGRDDGLVFVVELGSGEVVKTQKGKTFEWMPEQAHTGQTFAIIYVDQYFCNPPALIVTVD